MAEFYDEDTLFVSRRLYNAIAQWARPRGDITLVGGWAVYELVKPGRAMQSRDIDLIIHDNDALQAFDQAMPTWDLKWRTHGRNRFNDCHLIDDPTRTIVVDVFLDHRFEQHIITGRRATMGLAVKSAQGHGFLPSLDYMIDDKIHTIPRRQRDRESKQAKDLLDLHSLVFHNRAGAPPTALLASTTKRSRSLAKAALPGAAALRPQNQRELDEIGRWLDG